VFSSRSASTWVMFVVTVFDFALSTRAIAESVFKSSMAWRPLERVSQRPVTSDSRASRRSPGRFAAQHGHLTYGRISVHVTMEPPIPSSSCSNTRLVYGRREAMGASWLVGS
jgi:hypothetical protein